MTNEEATEILKNAAWLGTNKDREKIEEAVNMAIKALRSATDINVATKECSDCIKHGGDWECDHVHCHKGQRDTIYRNDAIDAIRNEFKKSPTTAIRAMEVLKGLPPAQPEKLYTKADYIMALHKEYGCSLTRAEEAHNKALEYLQDEMMMKGGKNEIN